MTIQQASTTRQDELTTVDPNSPALDPSEDNRAAVPLDGPARGRVAIVTADGFEDVEFFAPYYFFFAHGYQVDTLTPSGTSPVKGAKEIPLKEGITRIADADPADYRLIYVPGGHDAPPARAVSCGSIPATGSSVAPVGG